MYNIHLYIYMYLDGVFKLGIQQDDEIMLHTCTHVHVHISTMYTVYTCTCTSGGANLHDLSLMHGDAVVKVLGQLVQGTGSGSVHERVRGVEVGHQWSHCPLLTKCNTIVTPHATSGKGGRGKLVRTVETLYIYEFRLQNISVCS